MSTIEQATSISEEIRKELSLFKDFLVEIVEFPDGEQIYVDVDPIPSRNSFSSACIGIISRIVKQHDLDFFIYAKVGGKVCVSIY